MTITLRKTTTSEDEVVIVGSGSGGSAQGDTLKNFNTIYGSSHDDTIRGSAAPETFHGHRGDDTLYGGTVGGDTLDGGEGDDTVDYSQYPNHAALHFDLSANTITGTSTETGFQTITLRNIENVTGTRYDDTFTGNHRHNVLNGGPGSDTVDYSNAGGAAVVNLAEGSGTGVALISIENVTGSPHDDTFTASSGPNTIDGGDGIDTVYYQGPANSVRVTVNDDRTLSVSGGQAQGDTLINIERVLGPAVVGFITGTPGDDRDENAVTGTANNDLLYGLAGDDELRGLAGNDLIHGDGGDDTLHGGPGADTLIGGDGIDTAYYAGPPRSVTVERTADGTLIASGGEAEGDVLIGIERAIGPALGSLIAGTDDDDTLTGSLGNDLIEGYRGNDRLSGGPGDDILNGGPGNDTLNGGPGEDALNGGPGNDTADYSGSHAAVTVNLDTQAASGGHAHGDTLTGIENLTGSAHADVLEGDALANVLRGGDGNDKLSGGDGTDTLTGGAGNDSLTGGGSSDEFRFHAGFGADTIRDYTLGASLDASEQIYLCMGTLADPPSHSGADSGSDRVITVTFDDTTAGTITLIGITSSSTDFANLNIQTAPVDSDGNCVVSAPENLRAQADNNLGIIVRWDAPSDLGGKTLDGYRVEWVRTDDGTTAQSNLLDADQASHYIEGLATGSPYAVRVAAVATDSNSVQSSAWTAAVTVAEVWSEPLQAWFIEDTPFYSSHTGRINFTVDTNKNNSTILCVIDGGNINCPPYTLASLDRPANAAFTARISATVGTESVTSLLQEGKAAGPAPPQVVRASGGNGKLAVVWNGVPDNRSGGGSINAYIVESRQQKADLSWPAWNDAAVETAEKAASDREHTFTGLTNGAWQVRVRARNNANDTDDATNVLGISSEVQAVTLARPTPTCRARPRR